jgi:hypothetical protein
MMLVDDKKIRLAKRVPDRQNILEANVFMVGLLGLKSVVRVKKYYLWALVRDDSAEHLVEISFSIAIRIELDVTIRRVEHSNSTFQ